MIAGTSFPSGSSDAMERFSVCGRKEGQLNSNYLKEVIQSSRSIQVTKSLAEALITLYGEELNSALKKIQKALVEFRRNPADPDRCRCLDKLAAAYRSRDELQNTILSGVFKKIIENQSASVSGEKPSKGNRRAAAGASSVSEGKHLRGKRGAAAGPSSSGQSSRKMERPLEIRDTAEGLGESSEAHLEWSVLNPEFFQSCQTEEKILELRELAEKLLAIAPKEVVGDAPESKKWLKKEAGNRNIKDDFALFLVDPIGERKLNPPDLFAPWELKREIKIYDHGFVAVDEPGTRVREDALRFKDNPVKSNRSIYFAHSQQANSGRDSRKALKTVAPIAGSSSGSSSSSGRVPALVCKLSFESRPGHFIIKKASVRQALVGAVVPLDHEASISTEADVDSKLSGYSPDHIRWAREVVAGLSEMINNASSPASSASLSLSQKLKIGVASVARTCYLSAIFGWAVGGLRAQYLKNIIKEEVEEALGSRVEFSYRSPVIQCYAEGPRGEKYPRGRYLLSQLPYNSKSSDAFFNQTASSGQPPSCRFKHYEEQTQLVDFLGLISTDEEVHGAGRYDSVNQLMEELAGI